jgi:hypothetical protein
LEAIFRSNDDQRLAQGHFWFSTRAAHLHYQYFGAECDWMAHSGYKMWVEDCTGKEIDLTNLVGWYREWDYNRRWAWYSRRTELKASKYDNHGRHKKTYNYRRPQTHREMRFAADPEHMPYVRRKLRDIPHKWDDVYYEQQNNWKTNSKRKHQYRIKE